MSSGMLPKSFSDSRKTILLIPQLAISLIQSFASSRDLGTPPKSLISRVRIQHCKGVFLIALFSRSTRTQGSSLNCFAKNDVKPVPVISITLKPALSKSRATGRISSVLIRSAQRLCTPSRRVLSTISILLILIPGFVPAFDPHGVDGVLAEVLAFQQ